jgi:hypothetical protein
MIKGSGRRLILGAALLSSSGKNKLMRLLAVLTRCWQARQQSPTSLNTKIASEAVWLGNAEGAGQRRPENRDLLAIAAPQENADLSLEPGRDQSRDMLRAVPVPGEHSKDDCELDPAGITGVGETAKKRRLFRNF